MFRTILTNQLRTPITRTSIRSISSTQQRNSIIDSAKKTLNDLNHKVGKAAANTLEAAEDVSPKETLNQVNKKVGKAAANTMEAVEDIDPKDALNKANKKAGEVASEGLNKAEKAKDTIKENAQEKIHNEEGVAQDLKTDAANTSYNDVKEGVKKTAKDVKKSVKNDDQVQGAVNEGKETLDRAAKNANELKKDAAEKVSEKAEQYK
ncbi:Laminin-like protein epi-1 [Wickerhamomyces ciferrii]|uniref:Laminin-like protein epi-1 n=1 Tax=Wickerhamomyces ciferrii (strain ATCC 14091 / BCRC 22168 / CBS 111 / JCM 3599 / NBRC 0793 / NRRL Y-1031 F-60-10) TaxID=1206466 RepID=K0KIZ7_WICCF|nr:Laminin-like protein epi-1 [Wickerhamomyces ciferrii]CCH41424.1 Laminin-like protein epi-1 [Wickerhamomyces ciferrii]